MVKPYNVLVPSIDRRLSTWISLEDRRRGETSPAPRPTVTISRQYGCEGFPLAEKLKELLEQSSRETWNIYDKALLEKVARDEKLSLQMLQHLGDSTSRLDSFAFLLPDHVPHHGAFQLVAKHLLKIAGTGNAIIVGRGGAIVAHPLKNCYHFRLVADLETRVQSIMRRLEMSHQEAVKNVQANQKERDRFIKECLKADVSDPTWYDAVFNNARHSVEEIARSIFAYVATGWPDKEHFRKG